MKKRLIFALGILGLILISIYYWESISQRHLFKIARSCQHHQLEACNTLYTEEQTEEVFFFVKEIFDESCNKGNTSACNMFANILLQRNWPQHALSYFNEACRQGDSGACLKKADLLLADRKYEKAKEIYSKECQNENSYACVGEKISKVLGCTDFGQCQKLHKSVIKECRHGDATFCGLVVMDLLMPPYVYTKMRYVFEQEEPINTHKIAAMCSKICEQETSPLFPLLKIASQNTSQSWMRGKTSFCELAQQLHKEIEEEVKKKEQERLEEAKRAEELAKKAKKEKQRKLAQRQARKKGISPECATIYMRICRPCFGPSLAPGDPGLSMEQLIGIENLHQKYDCKTYYDFPENYSIENYKSSCDIYLYGNRYKSKYDICNNL
ncbi:MAG: hypothetical protein J6J74_01835 [Elusimicrobiaceae bacterium]|nr:hypothetical protein [Elusimicrobiaceae bacterium]